MGNCYSLCMPAFKPPANKISYSIEDACCVAKTGDIILFSGMSTNSTLIEAVCPSVWSHVGIIIEDPKAPNDPLIFEAVESDGGMIEAIHNEKRAGVRAVRLKRYLSIYKGNAIALRALQCEKEHISKLRKHMYDIIARQIVEQDGKPYETRWFEFINSRYRLFQSPKKTLDSFFCSELIAWVLMSAGLIDQTIHQSPNIYLPDDFGDTGEIQLITPTELFGSHITLGKEAFIQTTTNYSIKY